MDLQLQKISNVADIPTEAEFSLWVTSVLTHLQSPNIDQLTLCIRIVDNDEMADLNLTYRNKENATNVLSFPQELPEAIRQSLLEVGEQNSLGDVVLCAPIVAEEAEQQGKKISAHWAHLTLHGTLHLLGYDHIEDNEAIEMEALETAILGQLGFANPY